MSTRALDDDRTAAVSRPGISVSPLSGGPGNIACRLLHTALDAGHAERVCLIDEAGQWTYRELDERSNRIAHVLTYDFTIEPGDRVVLHAANSPMTVACWLAVVKVGAVAVIAAPLLRARELARIAKVSGARMCLCDAKLRRTVEEARRRVPTLADIITFNGGFTDSDPDPLEARKAGKPRVFDAFLGSEDDPSIVAFTTGDAGPGKAVWLSHGDVAAIVETAAAFLGLTADDRVCGTLAACSTVGLTAMVLAPLARGAACHLAEEPTPERLRRIIAKDRATVCMTSPSIYRRLIADGKAGDLATLRMAVSTGERLAPMTAGQCREALGIALTDAVETAEFGGIILAGASGTSLRPLPGYAVSAVTLDGTPNAVDIPGRLMVRGPTGGRIWQEDGNPARTRQEWSETGDLCVVDGSGGVRLLGRVEDVLTPDGRILPLDIVEDALLSQDGVGDCAVFATTDGEGAIDLNAYVAAAGDASNAALQARLQTAITTALADESGPPVPVRLHLLEQLPRNEGGKLQREKLPAA